MVIKKYCIKCKTDRDVNILDVLNKGKKRVVCGHCGTILLSESDVESLYWRYFGGDD